LVSQVDDDRSSIQDGDRVLLVVEDDPAFSATLVEVARERGYRALAASSGSEALELARDIGPDLILLDLKLPDMNGWVLLDRLKHMSETRHIPVHIVSAFGERRRGRLSGAVGVLEKPVARAALLSLLDTLQRLLERRAKRVLVVAADEESQQNLVDLVGGGDGSGVETVAVASGEEALSALDDHPFDCVVLSHRLPEAATIELLRRLERNPTLDGLPVVVFAEQELAPEARREVSRPRDHIVVKGVRTPEVLVDAAARFLHRAERDLPEPQRQMLRALAQSDPDLRGHKVLVVDDDVRNIFAITALLEQHGMDVVFAENGHEALAKLAEHEDVAAVLMDIMMPEMDGYEAMRRIREDARHSELPVIALTAKAMRGDREKCLEAGASDYVMKPIDPDQLVSLLRVWLQRSSPEKRRGA
jgi:hypothetical protein